MPAGHIVRHGHARAISEGALEFEEALALPELVTLLPSNSFGLRSVIRKGLSESHLHLWAVTSTEETWADNLLRSYSFLGLRARSPEEHRLLVLNHFAGRLLALAVWMSLLEGEPGSGHGRDEHSVEPRRLLSLLDRIYFARSSHEEREAARQLTDEFRQAVYGDLEVRDDEEEDEAKPRDGGDGAELEDPDRPEAEPCRCWKKKRPPLINHAVPCRYAFLLRWIAPTGHRLLGYRCSQALPGGIPETLQDRYRLVQQLHLAAHLRLVQLTPAKAATAEEVKAFDRRRYFLHQALFRYLVCRTHHWQMATQQGRTTGLRHFREFYGSRHREPRVNQLQGAELVFDRLRQWRGLRVVEGRISPPRRAQDLAQWVLAFARPKDRRIRKFGLVVHFKKEYEHQEDKSFRHVQAPVPRLRWGKRRRLVRDEGVRLYHLLRRPTPVTPFVVGIDACNLELATPPEVFAPVFRFLRELPIRASGSAWRYSPYFQLQPAIRQLMERRRLGMTYHVGEDFRHLLSGLRAIYEVVEFLRPQPGDRLGHGTALALHPLDWLEHNGYQAVLPRLEWLDTLVWVHHFLGPGDNLVGELAIEDLIQRYSWEIYSDAVSREYDPLHLWDGEKDPACRKRSARRGLMDWDWSPLTLWDAWSLRQLDPYLVDLPELFKGNLRLRPPRLASEEERRWHAVQERVLRTVRKTIGSRNAFLLLALYWLSPSVRKQGEEIIVVDMQPERARWLELCGRVEEKMKRLIQAKELVVEVNPSSNRIIGPMERYRQHHAFHLTLDENRRLSRQVRVSINTDNPAVCNTTLAHEHYLLGEILIRDGVPEAEVVEWLDWLRQNGEDYNFVRRLKDPEEDPHLGALVEWLRSIRRTVREARGRHAKYTAFWHWQRTTYLQSHGFTAPAIAADPGALERLLALEQCIRQLQTQGPGPLPAVEAELERLRRELAEVRKWLGRDAS